MMTWFQEEGRCCTSREIVDTPQHLPEQEFMVRRMGRGAAVRENLHESKKAEIMGY